MKSRTQPIAIADVAAALLASLEIPVTGSDWYDVPGPETLSARDILVRIAAAMGLRHPLLIEVPMLSPWLSSHWVRLVTRADWAVARELVVGLTDDMLAWDDRFWSLSGRTELVSFDEAVRDTLRRERAEPSVPGFWGGVERSVAGLAARRISQ